MKYLKNPYKLSFFIMLYEQILINTLDRTIFTSDIILQPLQYQEVIGNADILYCLFECDHEIYNNFQYAFDFQFNSYNDRDHLFFFLCNKA